MSKLGKFAAACVAVAFFFAGSPSAWAEPSIEVPAGATQADIVQALTDVDDGGTATGTVSAGTVLFAPDPLES